MERGGRRKAALRAHKNDELARAVAQMRRLERLIEQCEADLQELRAGVASFRADGVASYGQLEEARLIEERASKRVERLAVRLGELRSEHRAVVGRIAGLQRMIRKIEEREWD